MQPEEYRKMHDLERTYWWHQGRRRIVHGLLDQALSARPPGPPPAIADIGCGTGMLLEDLQELGPATGFDFSPIALRISKDRGLARLVRADACQMPAPDAAFDLMVALDVVEHIRDDRAIVAEFARLLRPGGALVLSVPAHPSLWSSHDIALHHYRRYTRRRLDDLLRSAGLPPQRLTYGMASPLLPALAWRIAMRPWRKPVPGPPRPDDNLHERARGHATDEIPIPAPINATLRSILQAEATILRHVNLPAGLSLFCIARKP